MPTLDDGGPEARARSASRDLGRGRRRSWLISPARCDRTRARLRELLQRLLRKPVIETELIRALGARYRRVLPK